MILQLLYIMPGVIVFIKALIILVSVFSWSISSAESQKCSAEDFDCLDKMARDFFQKKEVDKALKIFYINCIFNSECSGFQNYIKSGHHREYTEFPSFYEALDGHINGASFNQKNKRVQILEEELELLRDKNDQYLLDNNLLINQKRNFDKSLRDLRKSLSGKRKIESKIVKQLRKSNETLGSKNKDLSLENNKNQRKIIRYKERIKDKTSRIKNLESQTAYLEEKLRYKILEEKKVDVPLFLFNDKNSIFHKVGVIVDKYQWLIILTLLVLVLFLIYLCLKVLKANFKQRIMLKDDKKTKKKLKILEDQLA